MTLSRVVPAGDATIDLAAPDARGRLLELYRPPREHWLRLNLVGSVSGSAAGSDGTSETLSNPTDRLILGVIRELSDLVLVGAASVRAEGYYLPRAAALAIVTGSGDLAGHRITTTGDRGPLVVLCPASAVARARATLGATPATIVELAAEEGRMAAGDMLDALRGAGYRSIVCEGGPSLAAQLVEAGSVDEVCLTTSPLLNGSTLPLFGGNEFRERRLGLTQLLADDASCLYARWSLRGD